MADAPKPQRRRRRTRNVTLTVHNANSAAPTADSTPSGVSATPRRRRRVSRRRRQRVVVNPELIENNFVQGAFPFRRRSRLTRAIKREIKREGLEGPKVSVQQKITSTFGLIGPNVSGNTELELNFFLHPALAKEANDGTAFGPLQALAAQYSLWKIKYLTLRFTPMVGSSAVSGTVVRASLNLSQSPGGSNWSGLGTRLHLDMHPGQVATFHLRGDQVGGPRDGGWWFTDTNEEGSQSAGPIVEVHTLGKTLSTFRDQEWKGPLFLVEGIGLWQFANYQVKPALGTLERKETNADADIVANSGQPIVMELDAAGSAATFMDSLEPEALSPRAVPTGQYSVGETIFQIVDVGAQLAQSVIPPPFGWLIKGGWWFVKRILGRKRDGKASFAVYASLQDAQNNKPAIATGTVGNKSTTTRLLITQINSPNVGPNPTMAATTRGGAQTLSPGDYFRLSSTMISELFLNLPDGSTSASNRTNVPVSAIPGVWRANTGLPITPGGGVPTGGSFIQTPWWIGAPGRAPGIQGGGTVTNTNYIPTSQTGGYVYSLYRLINPRFSDQSGNVEYFSPEIPDNAANFCVLNGFNNDTKGTGTVDSTNPYAVYGRVVATNYIVSGTNPNLTMVINLIKTTTDYRQDADSVRDLTAFSGDNVGNAQVYLVPKPNPSTGSLWSIVERAVPADQYLLAISLTNDMASINGAYTPTTFLPTAYSRVESAVAPIFPYNLVGQMFPATSVDITLKYIDYHPPSQELVDQLKALRVPFVLDGFQANEPLPTLEVDEDEEGSDSTSVESSDSRDSVEDFMLALGNEMISLPRRWLKDPDFDKYIN